MSNRYVWNIYSLAFTEELDGPQNYSMTASFLGVDEPVFVRQAADAHISWSLQDPTVGNYNLLTGGDEYTEEATISIEPNYYYQLAYNSGRTSCYKAGSNGATAHLSFRSSGSNRRSCTLAADNVYYPLPRRSKGTPAGTVSNSGASTYPPRDYVSKSARIWPYSAPGMRGSGRASTSMYPLLGAALTI